ncbi:Glycerol-3-phosphate acyltransferase [bacterium HR40]|nr:Glycerol-3-phosphate acyltransferase [bacterium HR40]
MFDQPLPVPGSWFSLILAFGGGYLLGSLPFGLIFTRWAGAGDIRRVGSGNIGATNVLRTGRKGLAAATLIADILKGLLPVALADAWIGAGGAMVAGLGAVLGHCFPVWLRFRGGKGVATATGAVAAFTPFLLLLLAGVFVAILVASRYVSLASISAAVLAPILALLLGDLQAAELYVFFAAIVLVRHSDNIRRLLAGTENRFEWRWGQPGPSST